MNLPVHEEMFIIALLSFLFLIMGIKVLFNSTTEVQFVYEMSRIDCGEFFINSPRPERPALLIRTPISSLSLNVFSDLQIFLISSTLLKSPTTIYISA